MLGDKRPAPWKGINMTMIGITLPHFYKPACLPESAEHVQCPGQGARSCLLKQRGMPRPRGALPASGWPVRRGEGGESGSEVMAELCCEVLSVASPFPPAPI